MIKNMLDIPREAGAAELRSELAEVCGVLNVAHARLVALTAQALDQNLWQGWGIRSVEHWLCWQAGVSPSRASQIVAVARRYDELPATMATFTAGELSVDQVVTVAERVPAHNEAQAASFAKCATVSQLRKVLCKQMFTFPEAESEAASAPDFDTPVDGGVGTLGDVAVPAPIVAEGADAVRRAAAEGAASLVMGDDGSRSSCTSRPPSRPVPWSVRRLPRPVTGCSMRATPTSPGRTRCSTCAAGRWGPRRNHGRATTGSSCISTGLAVGSTPDPRCHRGCCAR